MPYYKAEFFIHGSTTGGCQFYASNLNCGYSHFTVSNAYHTNCDYGGTHQLVVLSHFNYLRHKYLKAYK